MDYSKFIYKHKYRGNKELSFDFNIKEHTGHNKKTFEDYLSLICFLDNHPEKQIFLTLNKVDDFFTENDKLVVNLRAYQNFCTQIGQNSQNRAQAFFSRKLRHYTEVEKRQIILDSTENDVVHIIRNFTTKQRQSFFKKLKCVKNVNFLKIKVDPSSLIITDENKTSYIKKIIEAGYDNDVWDCLVELNPSLVTKLSYARIHDTKSKIIKELNQRLQTGGFSETAGDDSWQKWIYKNNWLFGINYKKPIEKTKINVSGIIPDYLFPTLDGFVDVLEIKLPDDEVILEDTSHPGSWKWTSETNKAIGQVVNYLGEIDRLRLEIERNIKVKYRYEISLLKPRAYILIGNSTSWLPNKKEGLRKMNHALHGIEILTYKDLLDRGRQATNKNIFVHI